MFRFDSVSDFLQMGGHGPYVWAAYLISLSVIIWLVVSPLRRRQKLFREMARQQQREFERQRGTNDEQQVSTIE